MTSMFWVFIKCCVQAPILIQIGKFCRPLSWKLLTFITYRFVFFIWEIFIFLIRAESEKRLKICVEKSSLIICNRHNFCCSDVYGIQFMADRKSCFWVRSHLFVRFVCYMKGTVKKLAFSLSFSILKKKLRGLSPRANYTDRAAAAGRRS